MKRPSPQPRHDRVGRQLATAHETLYHGMRGFLKDLERAEREYHEEVAAQREKLGIDARYQAQPGAQGIEPCWDKATSAP